MAKWPSYNYREHSELCERLRAAITATALDGLCDMSVMLMFMASIASVRSSVENRVFLLCDWDGGRWV
jgi:hypothetical protein